MTTVKSLFGPEYEIEVTNSKVYIHSSKGYTVARLCRFSIEIFTDMNAPGVAYSFGIGKVSWKFFKRKVKEILGYDIIIDKPQLNWELK